MLNNLEMKKCLYIVLAILAATTAMVGAAAMGFDVPFLRQILGFILLTFIPGALILRILRIHNISSAESLVYSVGLSLVFLMFGGLLINILYPLMGITKPISLYPLMLTLALAILVLGVLAYIRDRDFVSPDRSNLPPIFSPPYLLLILLPLLGILGALLVSHYQNNLVLMVFLLAVAGVVALIASGKFIPEKAYPLAIILIAIGLLYHTTGALASPFVTGYDIQAERLVQRIVVMNGYWNPGLGGNLNTALSITFLWPIYSLMLGLNEVWILKIVYPLLSAIIPLILFLAYREQVGSRRAILAVFFFMTVLFFLIPTLGTRLVGGEIIFALLILLLVEKKLSPIQKSVLTIAFILALPVSYYSLAYISLFLFVVSWLLLTLIKNKRAVYWWGKLTAKLGNSSDALTEPAVKQPAAVLTGTLLGLFAVFALSWYMYTASGSMFNSIVKIPQHVLGSISEFFNPAVRESLVGTATGADFTTVSLSGRAFRIFQYTTQIFIIVGFITMLLRSKGLKLRAEYVALSMASALVLFLSIALPYFSGNLEVEKFYHFSLFFLAPLGILGGEVVWKMLVGLAQRRPKRLGMRVWAVPFDCDHPSSRCLTSLALAVLIPYFLFNTGFIFEITKSTLYNMVDTPSSEALSSYRLDMKVANNWEYRANEWLASTVDDNTPIYADVYATLTMYSWFGPRAKAFPLDTTQIPQSTYIYLKTRNIERNEAIFMLQRGEHIRFEHISFAKLPELSDQINRKNLIYDNGGARILAP